MKWADSGESHTIWVCEETFSSDISSSENDLWYYSTDYFYPENPFVWEIVLSTVWWSPPHETGEWGWEIAFIIKPAHTDVHKSTVTKSFCRGLSLNLLLSVRHYSVCKPCQPCYTGLRCKCFQTTLASVQQVHLMVLYMIWGWGKQSLIWPRPERSAFPEVFLLIRQTRVCINTHRHMHAQCTISSTVWYGQLSQAALYNWISWRLAAAEGWSETLCNLSGWTGSKVTPMHCKALPISQTAVFSILIQLSYQMQWHTVDG